jgi:hypothetical protein
LSEASLSFPKVHDGGFDSSIDVATNVAVS